MKLTYDVNVGVGGPIKRDKLWFYSAARWQDNESFVAGTFANKNAGDPNSWTYEADPTQQAVFFTKQKNVNGRLTWQANSRNKITFFGDNQWRDWDDCASDPFAGGDDAVPTSRGSSSRRWAGPHGQQPAAARGPAADQG